MDPFAKIPYIYKHWTAKRGVHGTQFEHVQEMFVDSVRKAALETTSNDSLWKTWCWVTHVTL